MSRILRADEQMELDKWLKVKGIVLTHRTRRDLSDVTKIALLFKNVNKKLVNMRNYTSHSNLALKLINWETFSLKVLRKTGLILTRPALEQLAMGELNAIRSLLYHLMRIECDSKQLNSRQGSPGKALQENDSQLSTSQDDDPETETVQLIPVPQTLTGAASEATPTPSKTDIDPNQQPQNLIGSKASYEELKRINDRKEDYIRALTEKVHYLMGVIEEKEKRINELLDHLTTLSVRIISMQTSLTDETQQPQTE